MRKSVKALVALAILVVAGCASPKVDITKTAKGFFEPTDPDSVEILQTLPRRQFVELGTVATSGWDAGNTAKMHNALREKAAGLGANAVVIQNSGINQTRYDSYLWSTGVAVRFQ